MQPVLTIMEKEDFKLLLSKLFTYFQKVPPKNQAVDLWFSRVNSIPLPAAKWIARQIADRESSAPYNVAKAFLDGWRDYKQAHPHLFVSELKQTECGDCHGTGLLFFKAFNEKLNRDQRVMCKCGSCSNSKRHVGPKVRIPTYTLKQLKEQNYEIV